MTKQILHQILTIIIVMVWIINGLFCKILNLVPRHQEIVANILGTTFSRPLTILIGCSEIIIAIWTLSGHGAKRNAIVQISIVLVMNIIEYTLVPELLLWGRFNILFAILFCSLVYYKAFVLNAKKE